MRGWILIGFFIRNLVKRTLKTGGRNKKKTRKKCIINYTSSDTHTQTQPQSKISEKFALQFFCACAFLRARSLSFSCSVSICLCRSRHLFIQYYFQKGCRCIAQELLNNPAGAKKKKNLNKFVSAHIIKHRFRFRFCLIQKCHVIYIYKQIHKHGGKYWNR